MPSMCHDVMTIQPSIDASGNLEVFETAVHTFCFDLLAKKSW